MYRRNTSSWLKHWDFIILDLVLLQAAFWVAYVMRNGIENMYFNMVYRNMAVLIMLIDLVLGFMMESYRGILRRGYWIEFKEVGKHILAVYAAIIIYLFALKVSNQYSRLAMLYFPLVAWGFLYVGRCLLKKWLRSHKGPASGKRGIMLVASTGNYEQLVENFVVNPYSEFKIIGIGLLDGEKNPSQWNGIPIVTGEERIVEFMKSSWVDEVMFSVPKEVSLPENLIEQCGIMGITVHLKLARAKADERKKKQIVENIEGYTVLSTSINRASQTQLILKRLMDVAGGLVGMLFTALIFIVVAPLIYIKSPGPIFFSQIRVGKNGRRFRIYKFRSMYMDAEERKKELMAQNNIKDGMMFKMDNDPRIIKGIGNFIRDYSLDEFPQFWNVLKGDMSLVGTRPPTVDEWEKYELHHRARLAIKPGLTGMWQVSGRSDITDFEEVVRLDTKYIQDWDLGLDIRILFKTVLVVLEKEGSK